MFCNRCGKTLPDDAVFCDGCGASFLAAPTPPQPPVQPPYTPPQPPVQPMQQPPVQPMQQQPMQPMQQPMQQPPMPPQYAPTQPVYPGQQPMYYGTPDPTFSNFFTTLKGIFSRNAVSAVANSAKSMTNEWILSLGAFVLLFGLSPMLVNIEGNAFGGLLDLNIGNSGVFFLLFALLGAMTVVTSVTTLYLFVKEAYLQAISPLQVLNMVGASTMPISAALLANMILGLFPGAALGLTAFVLAVSVILCIMLAYEGMQNLASLGSKPLLAFVGSGAAVSAVLLVFGWLFLMAVQ